LTQLSEDHMNRVAYIADPDGNWISLYHNEQ